MSLQLLEESNERWRIPRIVIESPTNAAFCLSSVSQPITYEREKGHPPRFPLTNVARVSSISFLPLPLRALGPTSATV